jgi:hypothetical protein
LGAFSELSREEELKWPVDLDDDKHSCLSAMQIQEVAICKLLVLELVAYHIDVQSSSESHLVGKKW